MTEEARQALRLNNLNLVEVNLLLAQLSDRLDKLEGLRGDPRFYASVNMGANRITNAARSVAAADAVVKSELDDLNISPAVSSTSLSFATPSIVNTITGTPAGGANINQVKTLADGQYYEVAEVVGVPGYNIQFTFMGITDFHAIGCRQDYNGAVTHWVGLDLYHPISASWHQLDIVRHSDSYYEWNNVYGIPGSAYVSNGNVLLRYYHYTAGNGAHDIYIDYVSLITFT